MRLRARIASLTLITVVAASACSATRRPLSDTASKGRDRRTGTESASRPSRFWQRFGPAEPVALTVAPNTIVAIGASGDIVEFQREPDRVRWSAQLGIRVLARPAISRSTVLATGGDEAVAVDRETGTVRWRVPVTDAGMIVHPGGESDNFVVTSGRSLLIGLDESTGARRWTTDFDSSGSFGLAATRGTALVLDGSPTSSRLRALDARTGVVLWSRTLPPTDSVPAASDGTFVVAVGDGSGASLTAVDAMTGESRWAVPVEVGVGPRGRPVTDGRSVAMLDASGTLRLYDARDGERVWARRVAESGAGTLTLGRDAVLLNGATGSLEVDRSDGRRSTHAVFMGVLVDQAVLGDTVVELIDVGGTGSVELRPA